MRKITHLSFLTFLFTLAALSATAALQTGTVAPGVHRPISPVPAIAAVNYDETPTEEGFVFYNRKLIAETMGKMRQLLLTFDDGPNPHTTPLVLDILKRWNLKGIFFVVGMNARKYPGLVKRIYDEGHTIGNHTYYHLDLRRFSHDRILKEIRDTNDLIMQATGVKPKLFRPPYGALNATVVNILRQEGMDIMLWTFDPRDWRNRSMAVTVASLKKQIHLDGGGKGGIILLHDPLTSTVAALDPLLTALSQCNLLPSPYSRDQPHGRGFWAAKPPSLLHGFEDRHSFPIEVVERPMLASLVKPPAHTDYSSVALLRAKRSGTLYTALLARAF